jgi:hypothetical protein
MFKQKKKKNTALLLFIGIVVVFLLLIGFTVKLLFFHSSPNTANRPHETGTNNNGNQVVQSEYFPQYKYFPPDKLLFVYQAEKSTTHYYRFPTPRVEDRSVEGILLKDVKSGDPVEVIIRTGSTTIKTHTTLPVLDDKPSSQATAQWIDGALWERIRDLTDGWIWTSKDHHDIQILHREHMLFVLHYSAQKKGYEWYVCFYDLYPHFPVQFSYTATMTDAEVDAILTSRVDLPCSQIALTELKMIDNYHWAKIDDWKNVVLPQAQLKLVELQHKWEKYVRSRHIDVGWKKPSGGE